MVIATRPAPEILVIGHTDEERVVRLADTLADQPIRAGDSLLLETRSGYVYERMECWRPALEDLRAYLGREPEAPDLAEIRAKVAELSLRCARLN